MIRWTPGRRIWVRGALTGASCGGARQGVPMPEALILDFTDAGEAEYQAVNKQLG